MNKEKFQVALGIDFDAEASWLGKAPENADKPILQSIGRYAVEEGLTPLLDLLRRRNIGATFFVPGYVADRYTKLVQVIHANGHEVGSHGYSHRSPPLLSMEEEREELLRGIEAITKATGERPVAWRSASWEFSKDTISLLLDAGVGISANFQDRDRPYRHVRDGKPIPLVELPVHWHLADAPYFLYGGQPGRILLPHSAAFEVWRDEFSGLYEKPGAYFHLTLHVQLIGHPSRLRMLDQLIEFIQGHERATFMRAQEIAETVAAFEPA